MRQMISSELTFNAKVLMPIIWIGSWAAGTLIVIWRVIMEGRNCDLPIWLAFLMPLILACGTALIYWHCIRMKVVSMDDEAFYVSNFLTEERVPLSDVQSVVLDNERDNSHPVTITFVHPSVFGKRITFMLRVSFFKNGAVDGVEQIRQAVAAARLVALKQPTPGVNANSDAIALAPDGIAPAPSGTDISSRGPRIRQTT